VKYMLLIYHNPHTLEALSEGELNALMNEAGTIMNELIESGEWVSGHGLADPSKSRAVRVRDGVPAVTDGPYLEAKEYVAGSATSRDAPPGWWRAAGELDPPGHACQSVGTGDV
jgi:hypothetical protein